MLDRLPSTALGAEQRHDQPAVSYAHAAATLTEFWSFPLFCWKIWRYTQHTHTHKHLKRRLRLESPSVAGHLLCSLRLRASDPCRVLPHWEAPFHLYGALRTGDWMDPGQWASGQAYNAITLLPYWITTSATFLAVLSESIDNTDTGRKGQTEVLYRGSPQHVLFFLWKLMYSSTVGFKVTFSHFF